MDKRAGSVLGLAMVALCLGGCAANDPGGVIPGGEQDAALFRQIVLSGRVPGRGVLTVAGYLSEHDLPLETPPCAEILCINAGVGVAEALDTGRNEIFIQLGFATGLDIKTFVRPPLNLALVIDTGSTLAADRLLALKEALHTLTEKLGEGDRLAVVSTGGSVQVLLPSGPVVSRPAVHRVVDGLRLSGSADPEQALRRAYTLVREAHVATRMDRVFLFTGGEIRPGSEASLLALVKQNADQNVGLSVFGLGRDVASSVVRGLGQSRGGQYLYLSDERRIAKVFAEDFALQVTPVAYDLEMTLSPAPGYQIGQVYGLPSQRAGSLVTVQAATAFLSRNRGASLVRVTPVANWGEGRMLLSSKLTYRARQELGLGDGNQRMDTEFGGTERLGEKTLWFSQAGVARTVALTNTALLVEQSLVAYETGKLDLALRELGRAQTALQAQLAMEPSAADLQGDLDVLATLKRTLLSQLDGVGGVGGPSKDMGTTEPVRILSCSLSGFRERGPSGGGALVGLALLGLLGRLGRRGRRGRRGQGGRSPRSRRASVALE